MPTFSTLRPIDVAINAPVGRIDVIASDRLDTVVTVSPTNPDKAADRRGAEETKVSLDGDRLTITAPKPRFSVVGPSESLDVIVEVPEGSRLTAEMAVGTVHSVGSLGATRIKASAADLDTVGDLWVRAMHGNVTVITADGNVEITADHGQIRAGTITGDAELKASHGTVTIGEIGGDLEGKLSYGDLEIDRALASVTAKTAYGSIRIGEVSSGSIQLESGFGRVAIGVQAGVAAWLDLAAKSGQVRNQLQSDSAPESSEQTVAVRARTQFGEIEITRAR